MEDAQTQEVSAFVKPVLTPDDLKRIRECDFYLKAKKIIQSAEDYREHEVGSAIFVVNKKSGKRVGQEYDAKATPDKYIVIENDNGFIFAKRINANGKPGVAISCLTIQYSSKHYELQVDDGYIESMLLDTQDKYDPASEAKALAKRKNKASRDNAKNRIIFDTIPEAYAFLSVAKVGDVIWESSYSYGTRVTQYTVDAIENRPAVKNHNPYRYSTHDNAYVDSGYTNVVILKLAMSPSTNANGYGYNKGISYKDICSTERSGYFYYKTKPVSPEDLAQ